jgi:GWxTD domain-containing protein
MTTSSKADMNVITRARFITRRILTATLIAALASACSARKPIPRQGPAAASSARSIPSALDVVRLYREIGLIAESSPVPFVGTTHALATASPDSTLELLTLSLPNRALTFAREGDHYRASYDVMLDVRQGATSVRRVQGRQAVRVAAYKETSRGDESLIFQQYIRLAPGSYNFALTVRDAESGRSTLREFPVTVPRFDVQGISSPIPIYQAESRTNRDTLSVLVPNPRATAIFGQDSTLLIYVEQYGAPVRLQVAVRDVNNATTWRDSLQLSRSPSMSSGTVALPLTRLGPGVGSFVAWSGTDTVRTPIVISFGEGLAITSFDEMLSYLRYFGQPDDLAALRTASPNDRGRAWLAFLRATDPNPATPEHEGLRDYFVRVEQANLRYREEGGPGWLTDRGRVFISLGDPDQIYEQGQGDIAQRNRVLIWDYAQYRVQLVFVDQSGFGRYRLTSTSEVEFQSLTRRIRQR